MSERPRLALFDIDGTLLVGKGIGRAAKSRAMRDVFGTDGGVQDIPFGGKTDWQIMLEALGPQGFSREQIGARMADYQTRFAAHMAALIGDFPVTALPGAHDLVAALRQRDDVLLGIVTGNTARTAPIKLRAGGFDPAWFPVGGYGDESPDRRDLPRLAIERAAAHLGQPVAASDTLVIGDTVNDITAARAVGARVVAVRTGFEDPADLEAAAPDLLLDDLTQFSAHVDF